MRTPPRVLRSALVSLVLTASALTEPLLEAAQRGGGGSAALREAAQLMNEGRTPEAIAAVRRELDSNPSSMQAANMLDVLGATTDARRVFQRAIDSAPDAASRAAAQRAMALSYAFDGDCENQIGRASWRARV